jgi:hypothetical protein
MTIRRTEQYQFKCDHCGATEIVYAVDPAVEMPEGWTAIPKKFSGGDHWYALIVSCPKCSEAE